MTAAGTEVERGQQVRPLLLARDAPGRREPERLRGSDDHGGRRALVPGRVRAGGPDQLARELDDIHARGHDPSGGGVAAAHLYRSAQSWPCHVCTLSGSSRNSQRGLSSVGSRYFGPFSPR